MGCDYYVITYLSVLLKNNKTEKIELSKDPHYVFYYDSDEETDRYVIEREIKMYKKSKIIYENNEWLIKNKEKIEFYKKLLKEYKD